MRKDTNWLTRITIFNKVLNILLNKTVKKRPLVSSSSGGNEERQ